MAQTIIQDMDDDIVTSKIFNEGLDYFFTHYISTEDILDPELRRYAEMLVEAIHGVEGRLEELGLEEE